MKNNNDIDDNVEASFLDNLKKSGDFKTPPDFFDEFQKNVQNKIHSESRSWLYLPQFKYALSGLAFAAVAVLVMYPGSSSTVAEFEFSDSEYVAYLDDNIDEITEDDIVEELEVAELNEVGEEIESKVYELITNQQITVTDSTKTNSNESTQESIDELTEEEILEYLIEEGYEDGDWDEL